ncbi:MAG TPA: M23 family metallopeptidase, partial [Candidatus Sulfotelmatobacter sp.]|nr:M23 family metallopeptidase [Candidatus Sulfotelmatobacter sp.]
DPSCPTHHFHSGIDIAPSCGTTIAAAEGGIAYTYYSSYGYGNHIIIVHGNGYSSVYGHMATLSAGNGATVGKGQTIGFEGSTGNSTGCHLHFEIRLNDQAQDPLNYLP